MSDLSDVLRDGLRTGSPAERKVLRVLLAGFPISGLQTTAAIAAQSGVSAPTVVRLVARLGFAGWPEFQARVRDELAQRTASPVVLYDETSFAAHAPRDPEHLSARSVASMTSAIRETFQALPDSELDSAITLLADPRRRLWIAGGRFTALLGRYLLLHLAQLRDGVHAVPDSAVEGAAALSGLGKRDVLVVFDYRRYENRSRRLAGLAKQRQATVVLFTDPWLSPISTLADVVMPTRVDSPSPYDSLVPLLALLEAIVAGVLARLGDQAHRHMQHIEQTAQQWQLYSEGEPGPSTDGGFGR